MDDEELVQEIWTAVYERLGEDLRVVTRYRGRGFETKMRDDIRQQYTDQEDQHIVSSTIVNQLSQSEIESTFKTGKYHGVVRIFEDAWVLSWPDTIESKSGVIISIQRSGSNATMDDVGWCVDHLEREISPQLP